MKTTLPGAGRSPSPEVESFYRPPQPLVAACRGLACFAARHLNSVRWQQACAEVPRTYCLGKCYAAPAAGSDSARPIIEVHAPEAVVLGRLVDGGRPTVEGYVADGGYAALEGALRRSPESLVQTIDESGLRGRGGAGFPTGRKWRSVSHEPASSKFVVANADEGDPGAYIDRFILEDDPHRLIEALAIAGHAVGAANGYIYLRSEYPQAQARLREALRDARAGGFLGDRIFGTRFSFDIELTAGRGSYVCGEETALLNSIEGRRPEVRTRPPYPSQHGLFGQPTLVHNVETLAAIPWIVQHGAEAYRSLGFSNSRGTKVVSLHSLFRRPGLYEVEFGIPVRRIVEDMGGGLRSGVLKGLIIGGPLAGVIPAALIDTLFGFEELHAIGASVGHGGVVAFDDRTSIAELVQHVFDFGAYESCGKCTPCRLGAPRIEEIFAGVARGQLGSRRQRGEWRDLIEALAKTSLCGHGSGLGEFAASVLVHYPEELARCFV